MFDHSVKVPRLYKTAAKISKDVYETKGSIKKLIYEGKHPNVKGLYALVTHMFQKSALLETLLKKSKLLQKEPRLNEWLAKILITELLWGKGVLQSEAKPIKTVLAYEQILKAHLSDNSNNLPEDFRNTSGKKPRYVRINTLKVTVNEAVEGFREEGWVLRDFSEKDNYPAFLDTVCNLNDGEFMRDFHIPELLIFPPNTQFYEHPRYKDGSIILQDKASCLPVFLLNPEPGSVVLDMCAAPGMKTTQIAAQMGNEGTIYATEIRPERFKTLEKICENAGATCVKALNVDVLTTTHKKFPKLDYILVDPSCSGSGMTDRVEVGAQRFDEDPNRIGNLASFQIKILRHAMARYRDVKRIVYSTCSNYPEENEQVVRQVLISGMHFKLVSAGSFINNQWLNFGSPEFEGIGDKCLYARPEIDLTNGFFVAVFEKVEKGEINEFFDLDWMNRNPLFLKKKAALEKALRETQNTEEDNITEKEPKNIKENPIIVHDDIILREGHEDVKNRIEAEGKQTEDSKQKHQPQAHEEVSVKSEHRHLEETAPKKKKKKKNKSRDTEIVEQETTTQMNPEIKITIEESSQKKEKKKRNKTRNDHNQQNENTTGEGFQKNKVKKRKMNESEEVSVKSEHKQPEETAPKKKKKKKSRDPESIEEETTAQVKQEISPESSQKKKTKKKSRDSDSIEEKTIAQVKQEISPESSQKKKKKKKNGNYVETPTEDNKLSFDIKNEILYEIESSIQSHKQEKSKKRKRNETPTEDDLSFDIKNEILNEIESSSQSISQAKSKKRKTNETPAEDDLSFDIKNEILNEIESSIQSTKQDKSKKRKRNETRAEEVADLHIKSEIDGCLKSIKKGK